MAIIKIRNAAIDLDAAEIPNLPATKITSGTFADARIADLSASKLTGSILDARLPANALNSNVDLTNLSASNLTSGTIPTARITALPAGVGGKVLQVVNVTDTTTRNSTATSFALNSSSLTANITPSATSSKIFVNLSCLFYINSSSGRLTIFRDSTNLAGSASNDSFLITDGDGKYFATSGITFLDSPSSTSAVNYQVRFKSDAGTQVQLVGGGMMNSLTLMEIGV